MPYQWTFSGPRWIATGSIFVGYVNQCCIRERPYSDGGITISGA